jgi:multiple sugar transport system substrate-binding protein
MKSKSLILCSCCLCFSILACTYGSALFEQPSLTPTSTPTSTATLELSGIPSSTPSPVEPVEVRWFVAGDNLETAGKLKTLVQEFNTKHGDQYRLSLDSVPTRSANDALRLLMTSEKSPDIVGPIDITKLGILAGYWLDLTDLIEENQYDLSDFWPSILDFYNSDVQGQIALPFSVHPSALWYNKDLFDAAGIDYPPHVWGGKYADGSDWTFDKLREIGMKLTLDNNGRDASNPNFTSDPYQIKQFGYHYFWADLRGEWSVFGAANFVNSSGNAQIPDVWWKAAHWYYKGMWEDQFILNAMSGCTGCNTFAEGKIAMAPQNAWYVCCVGSVNWDIAALPSFEGKITAKLHSDAFAIPKTSKHPQEAFQVLTILLDEFVMELKEIYFSMMLLPRKSMQEEYLSRMKAEFPGVDFQVFIDALEYIDIPSHQAALPGNSGAVKIYEDFHILYESKRNLDLDYQLNEMQNTLQDLFAYL